MLKFSLSTTNAQNAKVIAPNARRASKMSSTAYSTKGSGRLDPRTVLAYIVLIPVPAEPSVAIPAQPSLGPAIPTTLSPGDEHGVSHADPRLADAAQNVLIPIKAARDLGLDLIGQWTPKAQRAGAPIAAALPSSFQMNEQERIEPGASCTIEFAGHLKRADKLTVRCGEFRIDYEERFATLIGESLFRRH